MFCVMNIQKRKKTDIGGIQKEATRTAAEYNNRVMPGMDIFNVNLIQSNNWMQDIQQEIDKAGAHTRSNSVVALDTIYTASPDFFKGRNNAENDMFFEDCLKFHQERFGHVVSAVIHYDETTPHMHVISVPLTKDNRLSARDVIGNRAKMSQMQTAFYEQVGRDYGLERGIHMDGQEKKEHISAQEHELREIRQKTEREREALGAIQHSEQTARERAKEARQTAAELQKQVETIQEERQMQHKSLLQLTEAKHRAQKEVKRLNYTIKDKQAEFEAITADIDQATKNLEEVKDYLTQAQQNRLWEIEKQWDRNDFSR